ncbi:MAG: DMT family transporter [Bacilli bacterium]
MWLLAAVGTALCFGVNNTLFKWSTSKRLSKISIQFFFYLVAFILVLSYGIFNDAFHFSWLSIMIGVIAGVLNANGNIQMTKAFEKGPASITSILIATNAIIPVLAASLFFPESILFVQWVGIALMIGAAVVVQYQPGNGGSLEYRPWMTRVALSLLSFGFVGILMKMSTIEHIHLLDMLLSMYGGGLVYLLFFIGRQSVRLMEIKISIIVGALSIIGFSCYMFALQTGPASIIFPIISLNCMVVMIAGLLIFKERLRAHQFIGITVALIGLVLAKL